MNEMMNDIIGIDPEDVKKGDPILGIIETVDKKTFTWRGLTNPYIYGVGIFE